MAFERRVGASLLEYFGNDQLILEPAIVYEDDNGPGIAHPDALLILPSGRAIIEIKLTHCLDAQEQLEGLYLPLASLAFGRSDWALIEICKNWVKEPGVDIFYDIRQIPLQPPGRRRVLHLPFGR